MNNELLSYSEFTPLLESMEQEAREERSSKFVSMGITRESHPSLTVDHKSNVVSNLENIRRIRGQNYSDLSIQTALPLFPLFNIGYFEVKVLDLRSRGVVAVGLACKEYPNTAQPGWKRISYGYHSDDGNLYHNSGQPIGSIKVNEKNEMFGMGDVVGCGFNLESKEVFYTKNGQYLGVAFTGFNSEAIYPTVGIDQASIKFILDEKDFIFNIQSMREDLKQNMLSKALHPQNDEVSVLDSCAVIQEYLIHEGYLETLNALYSQIKENWAAMGDNLHNNINMYDTSMLKLRCQIRKHIANGHTEKAFALLKPHMKNMEQKIMKDSMNKLLLLLHSQIFVEKISCRKTLEAIDYAQEHLAQYMEHEGQSKEFIDSSNKNGVSSWFKLSDIIGLLAYQEPEQSPLKHLLDQGHRDRIINAVNELLLQYEKKIDQPVHTVLDRILRQLAIVYKESI